MKRRGFGLAVWQKIVLWAGVLLCIWRFMQVPAIFDAIINFYGAGMVPGTDIVLSPDDMIHLMVSSLLIVAAIIILFAKVVRSQPSVRVAAPAFLAEQTAVVVAPPAPKVKVPRKPRFVKSRAFVVRTAAAIARSVRRYMLIVLRITRIVARRAGAIMVLAAQDFWRWFAPYAHEFDAWLDEALNSRKPSAVAIQVGREVLRVVREAWKKLVNLNQRAQTHSRE